MAEPPTTSSSTGPSSSTSPPSAAPSTPPPSNTELPAPTTSPNTTPPAVGSQPKASPIRPNSLFSSTHSAAVQKILAQALREGKRISMYGKTCMVDYEDFMDRYIPPPPSKKEPKNLSSWMWNGPIKPENSKDTGAKNMNRWLKDTDNDDNQAQVGDIHEDGYKVVVTANKVDPLDETRQRCDLALYLKASAPQNRDDGANWSAIEVLFECKPELVSDDPFDEDEENFEPKSERRKENLGQIMSYAALVFTDQHRAHLFTIVFFGEMARIIRWDHSGVVVTKKFNYHSEPIKLGRFLWRFCHLSATQRGHDLTVTHVRSHTWEDDLMEKRAKTPIIEGGHDMGKHALMKSEPVKASRND